MIGWMGTDRIPERSKTIQAVTSASMMCPALESRIPALHFLRISVMKSHDRACQGNGERASLHGWLDAKTLGHFLATGGAYLRLPVSRTGCVASRRVCDSRGGREAVEPVGL